MTDILSQLKPLLPTLIPCPRLTELPYRADNSHLFAKIQQQAWSIWLDSCHGKTAITSKQYDIIAWQPFLTLSCSGDLSTLASANGETLFQTSSWPAFELLQTINNYYASCSDILSTFNATADLPFKGGAIGHFNYELIADRSLSPLAHQGDKQGIDLGIGFYNNFIVVDHQQRKTTLVCFDLTKHPTKNHNKDTLDKWQALFSAQPMTNEQTNAFKLLGPFRSNMTKAEYLQRFDKIIAYLQAGDCYQVNLAQRFTTKYRGNPWQAYRQLRNVSPAPFSAFLNLPHGKILCHSPENFLRVVGKDVETRPIKGTRARKNLNTEDQVQAKRLATSDKDKAENLMIVDLMRNDLSRNCSVGSVKVSKLFSLESYANVHHLVSTIQGKLATKHHSIELLRDCFPGGSITGAPKRRAMEIIAELEPQPRQAYCGCIGYISFNGDMNTNIAIRTLLCQQQNIHVWGGGGIVTDSKGESEYKESIQKVANLMTALEALK